MTNAVTETAVVRCAEDVVEVVLTRDDGTKELDYAALLTTDVKLPLLDGTGIDDIIPLLDPQNWQTCMPSAWCSMTLKGPRPDPAGTHNREFSYTEAVGPCPGWFTPTLRFNYSANYADRSFGLYFDLGEPDEELVVDFGHFAGRISGGAGSLELRLQTSKTVLFRSLGWGGTAMFLCAMGYADTAKEMITECLAPFVDHTRPIRLS